MKYPQLVSTRAVNAISDWLVSRLEQLGVEAPLIYSRLLLSLLHSSVQINDPIEFSNLESYLANRKGSKRIPHCDSDTLKKITAVQCLMDTVSSEQEISSIENLVDELCEKLSDIEKQSNEEEELPKEVPSVNKIVDCEDPRKRYYRAFPALSKEMEDSVWAPKRNTKALTWPTGNNVTTSSLHSHSHSQNALNNTAGVKRKYKRRRNQGISRGKTANVRKNSSTGNISPTWDTDFEGSWEMGRDLIKEFIIKQNNRNRSTSESDACNRKSEMMNLEKRMKQTFSGGEEEVEGEQEQEFYAKSQTIKMDPQQNELIVDISCDDFSAYSDIQPDEIANQIISDEGYSTTNEGGFTSFSETTDGKTSSSSVARRLYERDTSAESLNMQNEFAQLKAKFNSNVEALWKDNNIDNNASLTLLPQPPENHQNLENFWTNYYNHCFDVDKFVDEKQENNNNSIKKNSNDFFSMPNNFGGSSGKAECSNNNNSAAVNLKNSIIGESSVVFLQDSIWSDYPAKTQQGGAGGGEDTDFYVNAIGSVLNNEPMNEINIYDKDASNPFNMAAAKWSECSFETPFAPSTSTTSSNEPTSLMGLNKNDLRENMLKNSYLYGYKQSNTGASSNVVTKNVSTSSISAASSSSSLTSALSSSEIHGSINKGEKSTDKQSMSSQSSSVTLINHSSNSKFVEYSRIKSVYKFEGNNNNNSKIDYRNDDYHSGDGRSDSSISSNNSSSSSSSSSAQAQSSSAVTPCTEDENLLTSERTHFRPIKQSYADGHQFDITNNFDEIKFERSKSGFLYYESEKYLEYTRIDVFLSDEDLIYSSRNSSSLSTSDKSSRKSTTTTRTRNNFALKFRVKQIEKCSQTDESFNNNSSFTIHAHGRNINYNNKNNKIDIDDSCSDSESMIGSDCGNSLLLETAEKHVNIDKQWSMAEIGRRCIDNNNTTHTLWGMCAACNNNIKSLPANRLLRDEVNIEADEIMSDLKYMQDLYIGNDDWDDDFIDDCDSDTIRDCEFYQTPLEQPSIDEGGDDEQDHILYNLTKFISDLLKPENAKSLANALGGASQNLRNICNSGSSNTTSITTTTTTATINNNDQKKKTTMRSSIENCFNNINNRNNNNNNNEKNNNEYVGGLWSNDENIIWKQELKPISDNNFSSHLNNNNNEKSSFLKNLNWEYSNLAEIWKGASQTTDNNNEKKILEAATSSSSATRGITTVTTKQSPSTTKINQHIDHHNNKKNHCNDEISNNNNNNKNLLNVISLNISQQQKNNKHLNKSFENDHNYVHNFGTTTNNNNNNNNKVINRFDRKRRHSAASQNISGSGEEGGGGRGDRKCELRSNYDFCDNIIIGNKIEVMATTTTTTAKRDLDYGKLSSNINDSPATIITCKYWTTTLDTTTASQFFMDKGSHYDGISSLALNPSSILKHVAVVSRPLTR